MVEKGLVEEIPQQFSGNEKFVYKITGKRYHFLQISQEIEYNRSRLIGLFSFLFLL
jgi:hypothetical protein